MAKTALRQADGESYQLPNYRAALVVDSFYTAVPAAAMVKGFYSTAVLREASLSGQHIQGYGPYREFKDYPQAEAIRLLAECARRMYPDEPIREALRRMGWTVFPTFLSTMVGKVVFGALGDNLPAVMRMAPRGFEVSLSHGRCEVLSVTEHEAELRISDFYFFPDCYLVGVIEGTLAHYGRDAQVQIRPRDNSECDYYVRW